MKYEFTGETKTYGELVLHQIKAIKDFLNVKTGDIGGWIEKEENLSQEGNCWVSGNARVFDDARVSGNACVSGNAWVFGNARVSGNAWVSDDEHFLVIGRIGSRSDFTTFFRDQDNEISVKCGCFLGKLEKFEKAVTKTHGDNKHGAVYRLAIELAKAQIELDEVTE